MYEEMYNGLRKAILESGDDFSKKIVNSFDKIAEKYKEEPQQKTEKKVSVSELARANRIVKWGGIKWPTNTIWKMLNNRHEIIFSDKLDVYVSNLFDMSKSQLKKTILETEERAVKNQSDELSYINLTMGQDSEINLAF